LALVIPFENRHVFAVYFPHCCVVLFALRQQGCVVRLAARKISS